MFFKIAPRVGKHLGYFCKKISCQNLSKIAQSGHTVRLSCDPLASKAVIVLAQDYA